MEDAERETARLFRVSRTLHQLVQDRVSLSSQTFLYIIEVI